MSKTFVRITTVKGVTTIEVIEAMFCLWSFLIIFTKQPTNSGLKSQKWLDWLQKIPRKINVSLSLTKRKLAEKMNGICLINQVRSRMLPYTSKIAEFFSVTLFRAWFYDKQFSKIKFNLLKILEASQEHTRAMLVKLQTFIPQFN